MYEFMNNLLKDHDNGVFVFEALKFAHFFYLGLILAGILAGFFLLKNKSQESKLKLADRLVTIALILYIADFFLMPFSEHTIDMDKLPFHICTSMSIMCFASRRVKCLAKFKTTFTIMGLVGALMYLVYPSGVATADGYSYRIVQTCVYHGLMIAQGVFAIAYGECDLRWKTAKYDLVAIVALAVWAFLGNTLYAGTVYEECTVAEGLTHSVAVYDHAPNWFFVKHDALYLISDEIDVYFVPFAMIAVIFGMCALVRFIGIKSKAPSAVVEE